MTTPVDELKKVTIYTDGVCLGNPGPGGYAVVLLFGPHRKEISGGFRHTTSNRVELMAAIVGTSTTSPVRTVARYMVEEAKRYIEKNKGLFT